MTALFGGTLGDFFTFFIIPYVRICYDFPAAHGFYQDTVGNYFLFRASLVAQLVKNPPTMQETWVRSLGWEDTLEKGKATHSSILTWRIPWSV